MRKGSHHSKKARAAIGAAIKARVPNRLGAVLSASTKRKQALASRRLWSLPSFHRRAVEAMRRAQQRPETRERHRQAMAAYRQRRAAEAAAKAAEEGALVIRTRR